MNNASVASRNISSNLTYITWNLIGSGGESVTENILEEIMAKKFQIG